MYEYRCNRCAQVFTLLEPLDKRFHAAPQPPKLFGVFHRGKKCSACGSRDTERILSAFTASVSKSQADVMNDLKSMGNVSFSQAPAAPSAPSMPSGGSCPSCGNSSDD